MAAATSRRSCPSSAWTRRARGTGAAAAKSRLSTMACSRSIMGCSSAIGCSGCGSIISSALTFIVLPTPSPDVRVGQLSRQLHGLAEAGRGERDPDLPETLGLPRAYRPQANELQQRQKRDDDLVPAGVGLEERLEGDVVTEREARQDAL